MPWPIDALPYPFELGFMQRALVASVVVGVFAPMIGTFVVQKKMSLIGDGIGHLAFAGVGAGLVAGVSPIWAALVVAVAGALGIEWLRSRRTASGDLALALFFYSGIAAGVVLVSLGGGFDARLADVPVRPTAHGERPGDLRSSSGSASRSSPRCWCSVAALFAVVTDEDWSRVAGLPGRPPQHGPRRHRGGLRRGRDADRRAPARGGHDGAPGRERALIARVPRDDVVEPGDRVRPSWRGWPRRGSGAWPRAARSCCSRPGSSSSSSPSRFVSATGWMWPCAGASSRWCMWMNFSSTKNPRIAPAMTHEMPTVIPPSSASSGRIVEQRLAQERAPPRSSRGSGRPCGAAPDGRPGSRSRRRDQAHDQDRDDVWAQTVEEAASTR